MARFLLFGIVLLTFMKLIEDALRGVSERYGHRSPSAFSWRLFLGWGLAAAAAVWGVFWLMAAVSWDLGMFGILGLLAAPLVAVLVLTALAGLRQQARSARRFSAYRLALAAGAAWAAAYLVSAQHNAAANWIAVERLFGYALLLVGIVMWIGYLHSRGEDRTAARRAAHDPNSVSLSSP